MAGRAEIDIVANDKASNTVKGVGLRFTELSSALGLAEKAFTAVANVYNKTVGETQKYNLSIIDTARLMGTTTEEASRLVQVADDVRISQETLGQAFKQAAAKGIQPNIAGLAGLAEKYDSLDSSTEKTKLAIDTFGIRAGPEMQKLLELGKQGIIDYAASIESGLIVTEDAAAASLEYHENIDQLNDSFTAYKNNVSNDVIPILNDLFDVINANAEAAKAAEEANENLSAGEIRHRANLVLLREEFHNVDNAYQNSAGAMAAYYQNAAMAEDGTEGVGGAAEMAAIAANAAFDGFTKLSSAMIYNKAAANLDADAALQLGINMGIVDQEALTANKTLDLLAKALKSGQLTSGQYADAVERLNQNIGSIHDQEATITLNIITNGRLPSNLGKGDWMYSGGGNGAGKTTATGFAAGGSAAGTVWVGERGPELVNLPGGSRVHSNQDSMAMTGGIDYNALKKAIVMGVRDGMAKA